MLIALAIHDIVPPVVASLGPVDLAAGSAHDEHRLYVGTGLQRFVDRLNEMVIATGGRIYLTKDRFTRAGPSGAQFP